MSERVNVSVPNALRARMLTMDGRVNWSAVAAEAFAHRCNTMEAEQENGAEPMDLKAAIATIRELAPQLNDATDNANRVVAEVEAFLADECSLGLPVRIAINDIEWLAYCRVDGKFRIAVATGAELTPFDQCPRGLKLAACAQLPELLKALALEATRHIEGTRETVSAVAAEWDTE